MEGFGWRAVFLINVPVVVLALIGHPHDTTWAGVNEGRTELRFFKTVGLIVLTLIVVPPLWYWAFPEAPSTLPAPGIRVPVAAEVAVNVLDEGSGSPVVLVHGTSGNAYDWRVLTPLLNAAGLRTISYDQLRSATIGWAMATRAKW